MTLLAARETTTDPVADLHACAGRLAALDTDALDVAQQAEDLRLLGQVEAQVASAKLRLLASADRSKAAARAGLASTSQWAARAVNADPVVLHRQVQLAQQLETRTMTQLALARGEVTVEQAAVIMRADRQLPPGLTALQRTRIEESLVEKARTLSPNLLRRAARRALETVEADRHVVDAQENSLVVDEETEARRRTRLTLHDNQDGTVTGHFTVPQMQGHLLRKILQTITAPRRGRVGASQAQVGSAGRRDTDWDQARGAAFCEVIEHLPTDHLHPRTAATLVVTITEETLRGALSVAHLDTDAELSAGEARRLACGAGLIPAVLGGASQPLDLGRAARLFNEAQRTAIGLRQQTCAAEGCDRPFAWTELHHLDGWAEGGKTDLDNAVGVCHFHHQRIHDSAYEHRRDPDGAITFYQRGVRVLSSRLAP
jgi:hypothetical protein